jgi:hypothetical protein
MQTAAQLPVLPVVSDNTTFYMSVQPSTQVGGKTSYQFAATGIAFNPSTNVISFPGATTANTVNASSNMYVGTNRIEANVPHPFLLAGM